MASNTTVVFVPGAWHSPDAFKDVGAQLEKSGYRARYVDLVSVGASPALKDFSADVKAVRSVIKPEVDEERNVVVVVHSYGGLPGNEAVKDLDLDSRKKAGKKGGVSHIFFCCSFIIDEGQSLHSAFGNQDLPWFNIDDKKEIVRPDTPENIFYNDLSEADVKKWVAALQTHSYQTFHSKVTNPAWRTVPSTYLYCLKDQAIPIHIQKMMVEQTAKGVPVRTDTLDAGHSPFINMPQETAEAIKRAAEVPV